MRRRIPQRQRTSYLSTILSRLYGQLLHTFFPEWRILKGCRPPRSKFAKEAKDAKAASEKKRREVLNEPLQYEDDAPSSTV